MSCSMCDGQTIEVVLLDTWAVLGRGYLNASVPMTVCVNCGFKSTDYRAEEIREAVTKGCSK